MPVFSLCSTSSSVFIFFQVFVLSMPKYSTLLIPSEYYFEVLHGAAEVIVKKTTSSTSTSYDYYLHLLDEEQRRMQLEASENGTVPLSPPVRDIHFRYLAKLARARAAVCADPQLARWLPTVKDALLWPYHAVEGEKDAVDLREAGDLVAGLREVEEVNGSTSHETMPIVEAVQFLTNEATRPGLFELVPAPVAGTRVPYRVEALQPSSPQGAEDQGKPGQEQQLSWTRGNPDALKGPMHCRWNSSFHQLGSTEVGELRLTDATSQQLAQKLSASASPLAIISWPELVALHLSTLRAASTPVLMGTIQEILLSWGLGKAANSRVSSNQNYLPGVKDVVEDDALHERCMAARLEKAQEDGNRIRLQNGIYASVISVPHTILLVMRSESTLSSSILSSTALEDRERRLRSSPFRLAMQREALQGKLTAGDRRALEDQLHMSVDEAVARSVLKVVLASPSASLETLEKPEILERLTREFVLSPVLGAHRWEECCQVQAISLSSRVALSNPSGLPSGESEIRLFRVKVPINPFVVFHGPRVEGGFRGEEGVIRSLKRRRDERLDRLGEKVLMDSLRPVSEVSGSPTAKMPRLAGSSASLDHLVVQSTLVGAALRDAVESTVIKVLAMQPLSRAELMHHPELQPYHSSPNFEPVVKAVLKQRAQYRGKKYELSES